MNHEEFIKLYESSDNKQEDFKYFWYSSYYYEGGITYLMFLELISDENEYINCNWKYYEYPFTYRNKGTLKITKNDYYPESKYYLCKSEEHFKSMVENILLLS